MIRKIHPTIWLILFLVASFGGFIIIQETFDISYDTETSFLKEKFENFGIWSPIVYMALVAIAVIISPIPALPLYLVSVILWNPLIAIIYTIIGAQIGAIVCFFIARSIGKDVLEKIFKRDILIGKNLTDSQLGGIMLIARFFPIFHFDLISYAAGLTTISFRTFFWTTLIGITPKLLLFLYFGYSIFDQNYVIMSIMLVLIIILFILPFIMKKYNIMGFGTLHETLKLRKKKIKKIFTKTTRRVKGRFSR